ncbi:tyrosine-type recombinase/integrase [Paragemmobacter ruber]|uniref:Tyrosine-type recombinase/integrase n=1 Tax=Paragemmobacter ruber TaxID=1985673 RepID=A0ABW9Y1F1_9RHOB|nr:tyrosine-type recombinase/integrase [Rhodobacter ruber]NBE05966.1 tyrosine-type recombinase/integrase [Rhodobacter ruber]
MVKVSLQGINCIRSKLKDGTVREYHYAWRGKGAPMFWRSDSGVKVGSPEYLAALAECTPKGDLARGQFREVILAFLDSQDFAKLSPRYRKDIEISIRHPKNGIDQKFGTAPIAAISDPRIRGRVLAWRDSIGGKVGDDRVRHLQRIVKWGLDRGRIAQNQLANIASIYESNRAEILWHPEEIAAFEKGAPPHIARILIAATETGLRPGDLAQLRREHIHPTPKGQRIVLWTAKGKRHRRVASIPVTPRMAQIIAQAKGDHIITNLAGEPYQHGNYLGDAVSTWRDKLKLRSDLRLYDARGTAATRLFLAGADLKEIATHMGWSIKHASQVIERYVALSPEMTDTLADKLTRIETGTVLQNELQNGNPKIR